MKYRKLIHSYMYTDVEKVEKTTEFVERMKKVQEEVEAVLRKTGLVSFIYKWKINTLDVLEVGL